MSQNKENESSLKFAVLGNPVEHSLSHLIHRAFAQQCGVDLIYDRIQVNVDFFEQALESLMAQGYRGFNVTLPFKEEAHEICAKKGRLCALSGQARAVNTLMFSAQKTEPANIFESMKGFNTDGLGLVRDIQQRLKLDPRAKRILVLGAGGAARGIVPALKQAGAEVMISNRTHPRAELVAGLLDVKAVALEALQAAEKVKHHRFDWLINATSSELTLSSLDLCEELFEGIELAYDLMYRKDRMTTVFLQQAKDCKVPHTSDGLGMLIEQAAESFRIWHGMIPDTSEVFQGLETQMLQDHLQRLAHTTEHDFQEGTTLQ